MFRFVFFCSRDGSVCVLQRKQNRPYCEKGKKACPKMDTLYLKKMKDYLDLLVLLKPGLY